jgi:hypothetical protein
MYGNTMALDDEPKYYRNRDEGDQYEMQERSGTSSESPRSKIYTEPKTVVERKFTTRAGRMPLLEQELEPLRKVSPKVIGNLFDRVDFLRTRINEIQSALDTRKRLHTELVKEIDADIGDKQRMVAGLSDIDDIRDFKLDISTLRMEKRRENVQFWRDLVQLTTELRELMEEHQTESKIANLFRELKSGE